MPQIFDNIEAKLHVALRDSLEVSHRADYCVGYFNLRGWQHVDTLIDRWKGGEGHCCRLLIGMHQPPQETLKQLFGPSQRREAIDQATAIALKKKLAEEFRDQLTIGTPTNEDEAGLRRLVAQLKSKKVIVKLFLRHPLHAKLYLNYRQDRINPIIGYLGSSNLTLAGLVSQGELNVDVLEQDACRKLSAWFEARWTDRLCIDISQELADIIDQSWARPEQPSPYEIYIKMAYHLAQEARAGVDEFRIPSDFGDKLFDFQVAAVKIAAHHLNKYRGVIIGDVVGLGKTLMATALARILEDDHGVETLVICPRNLVRMWEDYRQEYRLRATIVAISQVQRRLPNLRRHRLVLIDESHNLRNREGARYRAIHEYLRANESRVILLSATPYNKAFLDLSSQLRLFIGEKDELRARPEKLLRELGETEFIRRHQCSVRSLAAFEKSSEPDDWRELMRHYLIRRTRSFIQQNYAIFDTARQRHYLTFTDGSRSYFPTRVPRTVRFSINPDDPHDQFARLFGDDVVDAINGLSLPRYGLKNYVVSTRRRALSEQEEGVIVRLSRSGSRLKGFCRTNLFKRLESSGYAFMLSVKRHILRNFVFLHALENDLPVPIGTQDHGVLDTAQHDDEREVFDDESNDANKEEDAEIFADAVQWAASPRDFEAQAADIYEDYRTKHRRQFRWLDAGLFRSELVEDLRADAEALMQVLRNAGPWDANRDAKLGALIDLVQQRHPTEKILLFTQFSDTVRYLTEQLGTSGIAKVKGVTGDSANPTESVHRFSPVSNNKREQVSRAEECRILLATDVLSEGQNLQDCAVIVNYDLPWAIIRLIQRAGRIDRIGQKADTIACYSFLPADGVEQIIRLRSRVSQRLRENAEVVGTDEEFFEDERARQPLLNLYHERAGVLDGEEDNEVDLASFAYQIWKNAIQSDPALERRIESLPPVVYSTRPHVPTPQQPEGALVFMRNSEGQDALAWVNTEGQSVTEAQFTILKAAECTPETRALERHANHHSMVEEGMRLISEHERLVGGQLGRPSGARFRAYERLKSYAEELATKRTPLPQLNKTIEEIYRFPLLQSATDTLNRQLRSGVSNEQLANLVIALRDDGRLCQVSDEVIKSEPQVICSLGLRHRV